ncbi:MAG: AI-2E family transporter [Clostridiales bacterium]|nr:AI-2E family transporter [Clostridiales bacterium]
MERTTTAHRRRLLLAISGGLVAAAVLRGVLRALAMQLLAASLLMLLALPLCRHLEKRLPGSAAALLSLGTLLLTAVLTLVLLLPPVAGQLRALANELPALVDNLQGLLLQFSAQLESRGIALTAVRDGVLSRLTDAAGSILSRVMGLASSLISSLSQLLLSPLMAFYLLRDRRKIAAGLTLLLPVAYRARGVRAAREMKRESAAFFRGQLMLSLLVGGMTALGLLLTGTPGWLLLGVLMGVFELVPYIGPVIAGAPAVLLSLQGGWGRALWTLAVLVIIQQIEGTLLSPRLMGSATSLHPMTVLLLVSAGGMLGGTLGMVAVIPLVVSIRGALRGWRE